MHPHLGNWSSGLGGIVAVSIVQLALCGGNLRVNMLDRAACLPTMIMTTQFIISQTDLNEDNLSLKGGGR